MGQPDIGASFWGTVIKNLVNPAGLMVLGVILVLLGVLGFLPQLVAAPISVGARIMVFFFGFWVAAFGAVAALTPSARLSRNIGIVAAVGGLLLVLVVWKIGSIEKWVYTYMFSSAGQEGLAGPTPAPTQVPGAASSSLPSPTPLSVGDTGWLQAGVVKACLDADVAAHRCSDNDPNRLFVAQNVLSLQSTPQNGATVTVTANTPLYAGNAEQIRNGAHGDFRGYVLKGSQISVLDHAGSTVEFSLAKAYLVWINAKIVSTP